MKSDPSLLLLASLGAALLTAGGAFLRAAFAEGVKGAGPRPIGDDGDSSDRLVRAEGELAELRDELAQSNSVKEAQRIEMVEQRQRSERQVQGAQAEIQRLASEVDAERARSKAAEEELKELKTKLSALEEEAKKPRSARPPPPDAKATAALEGQVADLQKKLKAASDEKDAARAKSEALERLVEGVRARSRELAEELKALKEASPGKVS
jgi:DNA repair exonuclease SbcCD ATPase subunit